MDLPSALVDTIAQGNAVLFLGAGASRGAQNSRGQQPPIGDELGKLLNEKFLGGRFSGYPLSSIAELAISETDLFTVQEYIRTIFSEFEPASFHRLIPTFRWHGIATTNYDLIMENAYGQSARPAQTLVPLIKNGDRVEDKLDVSRGMLYLKLHGCITRTSDSEIPLILTVDQYITHRNGRSRFFIT